MNNISVLSIGARYLQFRAKKTQRKTIIQPAEAKSQEISQAANDTKKINSPKQSKDSWGSGKVDYSSEWD